MRNEWRRWSDLVGLFVATGFVEGELAQSLLLVGDPGEGKSALLARFFSVRPIKVAMDATSDGLKKHVFPAMIKTGQRHLMLPEMYKLMQRRGPTADNTIGVLTLAMSGEMHDSFIGDTLPQEFEKGFQIGVLGAMPTKIFQDWRQTIGNTGLLSRMMPVHFKLSTPMRTEIQIAIAMQDRRFLSPVSYVWPERSMPIEYKGQRLAETILRVAKEIDNSDEQKNRLIRLVVSLSKGAALLDRDSSVTLTHIEKVREFVPLFRGDTST